VNIDPVPARGFFPDAGWDPVKSEDLPSLINIPQSLSFVVGTMFILTCLAVGLLCMSKG